QAEYFCIISGSKSEGFDEETWCGYTVYKIPYIAGDINDDGEINVRDAVLLAQYLAGWNVEINDSAADVNGAETVDIRDAVLLAQYLAGWNVELVGPPVPSIPDIPDEPVIPDEPDEPEESEDNEVLEDDI
ncbi:MAG: dockerin type I repeat-containing protein, partial [Clostridia bacterium]|nr:dockerin type I repeat-containing protein [Clostridia bacterium]